MENMNKKNLVLVFHNLEKEHLGKDVFLTPYYYAKFADYNLEIVYPQTKTNKSLPRTHRGVKLTPVKINLPHRIYTIWYYEWIIKSCIYLWKNAKKIDLLMCFHMFFRTYLNNLVYKKANPQGKVYVKLDIPDFIIRQINKRERNKIWSYIYDRMVKYSNCLTVETSDCYKKMNVLKCFQKYQEKFIYMPNGFDSEYANSLNIIPKCNSEKENIMITVGRIGTSQKNNELFMNAISSIDIKKWKFYFIGNICDDFKEVINNYFYSNPHLKDKVFFTGPILDKRKLWDFYNRAKVFVLTSTWESYGLVLNEARYFNDYILSTNVGAAEDIVNKQFGKIIPPDVDYFKENLQNIINGFIDIDVYKDNIKNKEIQWDTLVKRIKV